MEDYYYTFLYNACLVLSFTLRCLLLPCGLRWWLRPSAEPASGASDGDSTGSSVSPQAVRKILHVTTHGVKEEVTCAVCLSDVRQRDRVWELQNCCHVFHEACLDRWLDHHDDMTCPLCRAQLVPPPPPPPAPEPSWAVERLLYLFGDDVLFGNAISNC